MLEHDVLVGAELELELPNSPLYANKTAYSYFNTKLNYLKNKEYRKGISKLSIIDLGNIKYDRTVNCGFEFATKPYRSVMFCDGGEPHWKKAFALFKKDKTKVGDHVGMHVHVCKQDLTKEEIQKINYFIYRNLNICRMIGERSFNEYCRPEEPIEEEFEINGDHRYLTDVKNKRNHKHRVLNVARGKTIEFRFFKSTNDYNTFLRNMQFVIAAINFVKSSKDSVDFFRIGGANSISVFDGIRYDDEAGLDVIVGKFCKYVKKHKKTYKQLYNFLADHNWIKSRRNQTFRI